jgi:esterase
LVASSASPVFEWRIPLEKIFANYPKLCDALPMRAPFPGPTFFLRGGRSHYISESDTPRIHELFPQADIQTIAEAGHWIHADAPEEFVRLILAFLTADYRA